MQSSMAQDDLHRSNPPSIAPDAPLSDYEIRKKPWKYIGYRGYSDFISSEDDFFVLRRFDVLNVRVALALQDELSVLEEDLSRLDNRNDLVANIAKKLAQYNTFILQQSSLRKYSQAPKRDVKSIKTWHSNLNDRVIADEERTYLERMDDLICVVQRDKTPLRRLIDKSQRLRTLSIWRHKTKSPPDYDAGHVAYYSDERIDRFASAVIVVVGITMLITPIWILQAMETLKTKLVVITVFILAFLLILSFFMVSKPFEALGATAAYAAVLMVFIQFGKA
ncbi:hypothetical protein QQX98_010832 [Neonectria punicea]|uniref:DUF6594 domain-containing protein n=1 Tax=Neonectria punicea TaxID=979145 RepID=A0ABR1GNG6_9HYPO